MTASVVGCTFSDKIARFSLTGGCNPIPKDTRVGFNGVLGRGFRNCHSRLVVSSGTKRRV